MSSSLRKDQTVVGLLQPLIDPQLMADAGHARGVTAISLDAIPRTLSRAQSMDVLSSQANVGGYRAVLIAAAEYGRYFPLLTTAAGTARPANVLILGIGVAGLQAIATARRLGAIVNAYDVRSETKEQAESLGAKFIVLKSVADASGTGGYARELTAEERAAQQNELNGHIAGMDVIITTAQVPGRRPPLLVTADAVKGMKPGSVIVDMAASALGGNVELSKPDETVVTDNGVTIIAPTNLPATMPAGASQFYARNLSAFLLHFLKDGALNIDMADEITAATVITRDGAGRPGGDQEAARAGRRGGQPMSPELLNALAIFVLAILVGFEVISKVPATLHTPLMSGANSIHGIVLVGAMLIAADRRQPAQLRARLHRRRLRRGQRRRRLRRHRPDAPDVPQARDPGQGPRRRPNEPGVDLHASSSWRGSPAPRVRARPAPDELARHCTRRQPALRRGHDRRRSGDVRLAVRTRRSDLLNNPLADRHHRRSAS